MPNPVIHYNPNNDRSSIPTNGLNVIMHGFFQTKAQDVSVDILEFTRKISEVQRQFGFNGSLGILIRKVCYVMLNGDDLLGRPESLNNPYGTIQTALNFAGPDFNNWCIIVMPGQYVGDVVMPPNSNIYLHPGVEIVGNITLADGCNLQCEAGSVMIGNFSDSGAAVNAEICGCLELQGRILITGASTISATGHSFYGCTLNNVSAFFYCHFEKLAIDGASGSQIVCTTGSMYIYNLVAKDFFYDDPIVLGVGGDLNMFRCDMSNSLGCVSAANGIYAENCIFSSASTYALLLSGTGFTVTGCIMRAAAALSTDGNGSIINCIVESMDISVPTAALSIQAGADVIVRECSINSRGGGFAVEMVGTGKLTLYHNRISSLQADPVNMDAIFMEDTNNLVIGMGNTILAKGTGESVNCANPVNIKSISIDGSAANAAVNANVTETIGSLFVNAGVE